MVESIDDTQEIVVKPLGPQLKKLSCYAGATIMGDGKSCFILDVRQTMLLFRAGTSSRLGVPLSLVDRLEEISKSCIETTNGGMSVQYRDQILPLVPLANLLENSSIQFEDLPRILSVVVFSNRSRRVGFIVDQVYDIVTDELRARQQTTQFRLISSAIIGDHITDLINISSILRRYDPSWFVERTQPHSGGFEILLAEPSASHANRQTKSGTRRP